jgi:hypothetical protein
MPQPPLNPCSGLHRAAETRDNRFASSLGQRPWRRNNLYTYNDCRIRIPVGTLRIDDHAASLAPKDAGTKEGDEDVQGRTRVSRRHAGRSPEPQASQPCRRRSANYQYISCSALQQTFIFCLPLFRCAKPHTYLGNFPQATAISRSTASPSWRRDQYFGRSAFSYPSG